MSVGTEKGNLQASDELEGTSLPTKAYLVTEESVRFPTKDGYTIHGTYFSPVGAARSKCAVVFNAGAGIVSKSYRNFASFLAVSGIPVLTYDYRGIGQSKPPSLRHFSATIEDWAEFDCAAAIDWMHSRCAQARLVGIGHSVGSLLFGGAPNSGKLDGLIMIGAHTGFYGDYRRSYRLPMAVLWHAVMPAFTHLFGYFPGRLLRLGDDIPKGVAMQWARRRTPISRSSSTALPINRMQRLVKRFSQTKLDTLIVTFTDDGFATEAGAARVRDYFPRLTVEHWLISPSQIGVKRIGHFGFFRQQARFSMWPKIVNYLDSAQNGAERDATKLEALRDWDGRA